MMAPLSLEELERKTQTMCKTNLPEKYKISVNGRADMEQTKLELRGVVAISGREM